MKTYQAIEMAKQSAAYRLRLAYKVAEKLEDEMKQECLNCGEPTSEEFCSEKCREEYETYERVADEKEYRHSVARGYIKPEKKEP